MSTLPSPTGILLAPQLASAVGGQQFSYGFLQVSYGNGTQTNVPLNTLTDSSGDIIDPATDESAQQIVASLGTDGSTPPAFDGASTGVRGWLRQIWKALSGTLNVAVASLPLPAGAATDGSSQAILKALGAPAQTSDVAAVAGLLARGQQPSANSLPVALASDEPFVAAVGTVNDAASASGAPSTAIAALRAIRDKLLGTVAVTGTFFQATQPISAAALPLPAGAATDGSSQAILKALGTMLSVSDGNNAPFSNSAPLAAGAAAVAPGRSVGVVGTAAGNIVLALAGGSTITLPVGLGWQVFPFAATGFSWPSSGAGAGTVSNLS